MNETILVVGGGISGLTAAVEAAEAGFDVLLLEKKPGLGGRVAQLNLYFPKLCSPNCGLEIIFKRLAANSLRCLGSLNPVWIADAMSRGIDGVLLMGCRQGEDYQCHFINGSELARTRIMNVSETLDRMGLEAGRIKMVEVEIIDYTKIPAILDGFADELAALGPNPLKGF
jgi:coenzyme F420-reducing hydrogenase delta subunit